MYTQGLARNGANFAALTPIDFIARAATVYPQRLAIVHGALRQDWATTYARCRQLASALQKAGVGQGDTVAVMLPNIPAMVEVHFGVPMSGAVLNTLNTRLEPESLAFMLDYAQAKVLLVDREFVGVMSKALALCQVKPLLIDVTDPEYAIAADPLGNLDYEDFICWRRCGFRMAAAGRRV
jgi:fatty-acyl-CoA synthase